MKHKFLLGGILTVSLAFILRIFNLTLIPIFVDEAIYIRWAQIMKAEETLRFLPLSDGKQPLFMWLVIPFLKISSDPLFAGRLVAVFSGVGTLLGIFALTYILFKSKKASVIAGLIYAVSPFSLFFDRLALADSLLSCFGVWTAVFAVLTVQKVRLDTAMLAGFSLGGALITKSPGIYFALLAPLSLVFADWPKKAKDKLSKLSIFVFLFTSAYLIGFAIYNILRLGPNFHMIAIRNKDYVYPLTHIFSSPFDPLKPFLDRSLEYFTILGPFILIVLILLGVIFNFKKYFYQIFFLTAWLLIPIFLSSEFSKTMTARYIYFSFPYAVILASMNFIKSKNLKLLSVKNAILVLFLLTAILFDAKLLTNPEKANLPRSERSGYLEDWTAGHGIKDVGEFVKKEAATGKVVVGTEGYFGTLPDGLQMYLNKSPEITVIGIGLPLKELPKQLRESKDSGNKTYLVVNDSRIETDPSTLPLKLLSSYPKAVRPDGSQENLLLFEVQ